MNITISSTIGQIGGQGDVVQSIEYGPWGEVRAESGAGFQSFGYAGGIWDADTRLVRFGARLYDAEIGRWTSKDPIGFAGGQENFYVYVGNDPILRVDLAGLGADDPWYEDAGEFLGHVNPWNGALVNSAWGGMLALAARATHGEWDSSHEDVWVVKGGWLSLAPEGTAFTLGPFVIASDTCLPLEMGIEHTAYTSHPRGITVAEHEAGHALVSTQLGLAYIPAWLVGLAEDYLTDGSLDGSNIFEMTATVLAHQERRNR